MKIHWVTVFVLTANAIAHVRIVLLKGGQLLRLSTDISKELLKSFFCNLINICSLNFLLKTTLVNSHSWKVCSSHFSQAL